MDVRIWTAVLRFKQRNTLIENHIVSHAGLFTVRNGNGWGNFSSL
jgi:hypothetical protein